MAVVLGFVAAATVLAFDVRAKVNGVMTYCGNGLIGVQVPLVDEQSRPYSLECDAAIGRWRVGAAGSALAVFLLSTAVGELTAGRRAAKA